SGSGRHWQWLPGSVRCDLHSMSLAGYPSGSAGASAQIAGASAVCGTVSEPYLSGHQRPNVLLYYLLKGYTFGEAAGASTPMIGWMCMNIGDPLYTPLAVGKVKVLDTHKPTLAGGYPQVVPVRKGMADVYVKVLVADAPMPEMALCKIEFGLTADYGQSGDSGPGYFRRHRVHLPGLLAGKQYHYRVILTDPVGNVTVGKDRTFTTAKKAFPQYVLDTREIQMDEGGKATFTVKLLAKPGRKFLTNVSHVSGRHRLKVDKRKIWYDDTNFAKAVTVTLTSSADKTAQDQVTVLRIHDYNKLLVPVTLTVRITNTAPPRSFVVSPRMIEIDEGGSASFVVKLAAKPTQYVPVKLSAAGGDNDITFRPSGLTFLLSNWSVPQTVTVKSAPDADAYDDAKLIGISAKGLNGESVTVRVKDTGGAQSP
ncbi:hypothetical protein LCGC14_1484200, partial [marine sediment metagenome]